MLPFGKNNRWCSGHGHIPLGHGRNTKNCKNHNFDAFQFYTFIFTLNNTEIIFKKLSICS